MSSESGPCIFCRIVQGVAPASYLYRDGLCTAFLDIEPINPGHLLIIPNRHAACLDDMDAEAAGHLMTVGHRLASVLRRSGLRCEGVNLFLADGEAAGQEVFHVHLHVFPRYRGDDFGLRFGPDRRVKPREELENIAASLRRVMD